MQFITEDQVPKQYRINESQGIQGSDPEYISQQLDLIDQNKPTKEFMNYYPLLHRMYSRSNNRKEIRQKIMGICQHIKNINEDNYEDLKNITLNQN